MTRRTVLSLITYVKVSICIPSSNQLPLWNTPVFKKRPNFLNSSPTSTDGALRLLSCSSDRRTACARAQFSGCSSTTNAHSEKGQMAVCCQNLPLGALSSRSAPSLLICGLFKKFGLFLNTRRFRKLR